MNPTCSHHSHDKAGGPWLDNTSVLAAPLNPSPGEGPWSLEKKPESSAGWHWVPPLSLPPRMCHSVSSSLACRSGHRRARRNWQVAQAPCRSLRRQSNTQRACANGVCAEKCGVWVARPRLPLPGENLATVSSTWLTDKKKELRRVSSPIEGTCAHNRAGLEFVRCQ